MSTKTLMTVEDFVQLSTSEIEDYELVEGELILSSSGTPRHAQLRRRIERLVENFFERNAIGEPFGEVGCRVSDDTVRRPDLAIYLSEKNKLIDRNRIPIPFAPDIAVEVISPSEKVVDVNRKVRDYLGAGCQEVWLVDDANGELFVHAKGGIRMLAGAEVLETALLPGFAVTVAELLA